MMIHSDLSPSSSSSRNNCFFFSNINLCEKLKIKSENFQEYFGNLVRRKLLNLGSKKEFNTVNTTSSSPTLALAQMRGVRDKEEKEKEKGKEKEEENDFPTPMNSESKVLCVEGIETCQMYPNISVSMGCGGGSSDSNSSSSSSSAGTVTLEIAGILEMEKQRLRNVQKNVES